MMLRTASRRVGAPSVSTAVLTAARSFSTGDKDRLLIFDTTLRDGEQSPGATLYLKEKLVIARQLSKLGVDVCEAGFPIASEGDFDAVKAVAEEIGPLMEGREHGPMRICGLSRAVEKDIHRCWDAVRHAPSHRIHTFLATSDIHLEHKLSISRDECIRRSAEAVKYARSLVDQTGGDVEFSAEDAGRSDPDFLCEVFGEVIKAGATVLNVPDTVGYTTPVEYGLLFKYLIENTPGAENVVFSTHCHNDLGLATANTLSAVEYGARQAEVTVNGIGERAGNTSIEEIIMALATRPNSFPVYTSCHTREIMKASRAVSNFTGIIVQPNKAIVGANAFAHEAGIHQDGVLKHSQTYEIMTPESVGLESNALVLGKHSGKHAYRKRLEELGYTDLSNEQVAAFVDMFKALADEKKTVSDADIEALINNEIYKPDPVWELVSVHVTAGDRVAPTATVCMLHQDGTEITKSDIGTGPVDAIYQAIGLVTGSTTSAKLASFEIGSITEASDALGEVTVKLKPDLSAQGYTDSGGSLTYTGKGADIDILVASARAYVNALNRMLSADTDPREFKEAAKMKLEGAAGV